MKSLLKNKKDLKKILYISFSFACVFLPLAVLPFHFALPFAIFDIFIFTMNFYLVEKRAETAEDLLFVLTKVIIDRHIIDSRNSQN